MKSGLNLDIPEKVAEFNSLIDKILPKKIFYKLLLRGKGLDFEGYRAFGSDDDASNIDWKASIRANNLLVKQYSEEKEIKVIFIIDVSENMVFGSTEKLKCEYSAELAAALFHVLLYSGNKTGFCLFNSEKINIILPSSGKRQFEIFVREISNPENYKGTSNLKEVLNEVLPNLDSSFSLVIIISDFLKVNKTYLSEFQKLGGLIETVAIIVRDSLDNSFPEIDKEIIIEDPASGEKLIINPKLLKNIYEKRTKEQMNLIQSIFQESKIDFLSLTTNEDFLFPLADFLKRRSGRR